MFKKGIKNPNWQGGKTIKKCLICGKVFKINNFRIKTAKYCSQICYQKSERSEKTIKKMSKNHSGNKNYFHGKHFIGENHPHWKGGKIIIEGYVFIYSPNHPFKVFGRYVQEHRLIVEKHIGRYLSSKEKVHHFDKIKTNNNPRNLIAFTSESAHQRFHHNPLNIKPEEIIFDGRNLS